MEIVSGTALPAVCLGIAACVNALFIGKKEKKEKKLTISVWLRLFICGQIALMKTAARTRADEEQGVSIHRYAYLFIETEFHQDQSDSSAFEYAHKVTQTENKKVFHGFINVHQVNVQHTVRSATF